jgi:hypothetical protein
MADATYAIPNFLGGEISDFAQGRFDRPDYRVSLNICLNALPVEIGAWTRRSGTQHAGHTRGGAPGRVIKFDFEQRAPYTLEFTDGRVRFRNGSSLVTDSTQVIVAISSANPAVVQTTSATDWETDDTLIFSSPSAPLLENRQFFATKVDTTHFELTDALTGDPIDGSTLGTLASGATVSRVQELSTVYVGSTWESLRAVQAETTDILLQSTIAPQALTVPELPADGEDAVFEIASAVFNDGPYLDPFTNGVQANPNQKTGVIQITFSFPTYDATKSYPAGAFVTSSSVNYVSLVDQNVGHTPASSPTYWQATSASAAFNDGRGLLGTDIGRLVRLFSEPALWNVATAYSTGNIVTYNPSGQPGAATYWQCLVGNTGKAPGADLTHWQLVSQNGALWTWGKIVGFSNLISGSLSGSLNIGSMTANGGVAAAFDGTLSKSNSTCAAYGEDISFPSSDITISGYIGKDYSASPQQISSATYYPASDLGYCHGFVIGAATVGRVTLNLRASQTVPATASSGTLLGTGTFTVNNTSALSIDSSDTSTAWNYVWIEVVAEWQGGGFFPAGDYFIYCSQVQFFNPTSTTTGNGMTVELLGPALLYTDPIRTWRLGLFSNTTGFPSCGAYHEGRLWLGGVVPNRFDACVSNGIVGGTINFAPTDQYGTVAASSAISYVLNSDSVNPIFWMQPDLQGLIIGTQAGEWLVQAPTTGPIAPTNIAARRVTKIGSANVEPRRTEHTNVFVKRYGRKLIEYFADANFNKLSGPNLADKAEHIVKAGIAEIAYTEAVTPVIWGRDADGALFGVTYKRDTLTTTQTATFVAWHRHALGSGRTVESICNGPSADGDLDALTMVTNDADTGVRHVEILTDTIDEEATLADAWFLDNAVRPSSTSSTNTPSDGAPYGGLTINGLWHLNGETVQVYADGLDCGDRGTGSTGYTDFVVEDGSVFVPYGDSVSAGCGRGLFTAAFAATADIVVGFTYNSDGQTVRPISPQDSGARNGPALGKTRRNHRYSALLSNTLGVSFGSTFSTLRAAQLRKANGDPIEPLTMFSGVHSDTIDDNYSYDGMLAWRVSRPWPANIVAISGNIQTQDR